MATKKRKYAYKSGLRLKNNLGAVIKAEREKQGKTMQEVCEKAGMHTAHWSALEHKKDGARVSLATADRIAYGLGKTIMFFFKK